MKAYLLSKQAPLFYVTFWWLIFVVLSVTHSNLFQSLNIIGFLFLIIVPGGLTLTAMRLKGLEFWGYIGLTIGFSLLELMVLGLLGNTILPLVGIAQPLATTVLLGEVSFMTVVLIIVNWLRWENKKISFKRFLLFRNVRDCLFACLPALFVVLSVFGTIRLNNGASNILTMIMLGSIGVYVLVLVNYTEKVDKNVIPVALFFISLALLLMTSLRGWYITGHDIQTEYRTFQMANDAGFWSMATYQNPYNACMSITILPTIFSKLLNVSDPYIYKFLFQIFFAMCPSIVYAISRFWTNRRISFIGAVYFFSFTTFFADMPFLIRQEIAFLFYALMLYTVFNTKLSLNMRRILFMVMGIGVILSHYSTTYTILFIFGLVILSNPFFSWLIDKIKNRQIFKNSALVDDYKNRNKAKANINMVMVVCLFGLSFIWTSLITKTGGTAANVARETYNAITDGFSGDNRSVDATAMVSFNKPDKNQQLINYIEAAIEPIRKSVSPDIFYDDSILNNYPIIALPDETVPYTKIGLFLKDHGIAIDKYVLIFNQVLAKILEILAPIGMLYLLFRNKLVKKGVNREIYFIAGYSLFFVFLNIVLPVLSVRYGIYRAIQQSMFIISPIIAIANILLFVWLYGLIRILLKSFKCKKFFSIRYDKKIETLSSILVVVFFLSSTSFTAHVFGGNTATLSLDNSGRYYDNYLILASEVSGVDWLKNSTNQRIDSESGVRIDIQTDRYTHNKVASMSELSTYNDIMPGVIRKEGYVFLGKATVTKQRATITYGGDQIVFRFPNKFLENNKNLIYNNKEQKIYK